MSEKAELGDADGSEGRIGRHRKSADRQGPQSSAVPAIPATALDPVLAARFAGLRHVDDEMPGITRHAAANGFDYRDPHGALVRDIETLKRIRSLAIPPAWQSVWICPIANGHLQATGRDQRGRKQYRYHPRWRQVRDQSKYDKVLVFGHALPLIRRRVDADLRRHGLPRERVLAAVVRLMEMTLMRVGNPEYARDNHSYGLTTLRNRHVAINEGRLHLSFRGKGGRRYESDVSDRRLARIVGACRELPGFELFQYLDEDGERHAIDSADVNAYLRDITGEEITAKDFRTWAATMLAARELRDVEPAEGETKRKGQIARAVENVARQLCNTPAICRRCYIHPAIIEGFSDGSLAMVLRRQPPAAGASKLGLRAEEEAVVDFLRLRAANQAGPAAAKAVERGTCQMPGLQRLN